MILLKDFVVFQMYLQQLMQPMQQISGLWKRLRMNWVDIELVLELMTTHDEIPEPDDPIEVMTKSGTIEFKNVCFTYDSKKEPAD